MISRRRQGVLVSTCAFVIALILVPPAAATPTNLEAYEVTITDGQQLETLSEQGYDVVEGRDGNKLEIIATEPQVNALEKLGIDAELKVVDGMTTSEAATQAVHPDGSYDVYRPYFNNDCNADDCYVGRDANGDRRLTLYQEMRRLANDPDNRHFVKPVVIGHSLNGVPILALRVTRDSREASNPDGSQPAVLYNANQHAREWITPEMVRRLAYLYIDNYGGSGPAIGTDGNPVAGVTAEELTHLVNTRELWFVLSANPDGYDFTFTPGNRLWRKNLRDNNGDGQITIGDGVDPNRNYPTYWNYDDEGSSTDPSSDTYRGVAPGSEPETQAMDGLLKRIGFEFMINYHSAAELLLYGHGFQVQTESPDDAVYRALSGTDADPAIAGMAPGAPDPYDPDLSSELYTTNGETTEHAHSRYGTLAWTPEMDISDPARGGGIDTDRDGDIDILSDFAFQDSEADLQDAFEKNVPFALDVAHSADDPGNPESHLGRTTPNFEIHPFSSSYGTPQPVEVNVKRELGDVTVHWKVNGGAEQSASTTEFTGGERYGNNQNVYYHYVRGAVTGGAPGDDVSVWFEAGGKKSQQFSYTVESDTGDQVLVVSAEDYLGTTNSPAYPSTAGPFYASYYTNALTANGISSDVYDIDAHDYEAPDQLGVLSHYDAVIWYTGNDLLTRRPGQGPGTGVARTVNDTIINVRDYLNEGGKLFYTGQYAAVSQAQAFVFNVESEPPFCPPGGNAIASACIPLSNDFLQYYLGAFAQVDAAGIPFEAPDPAAAAALPMQFAGGAFGSSPVSLNGAGSANNQEHVYSMLETSSVLSETDYPLFASDRAIQINRPSSFDPATGSNYVIAASEDEGFQRLRKTIDLTGATDASMSFKVSYDTEAEFDYVIVEAHPVGSNDWTTLEDQNGHTSTSVGQSCGIDWRSVHPFIDHYQTVGDDPNTPDVEDCYGTGTTGEWHGATGNSGGYQTWDVDLSAYAGQQVEISISYVQDFAVNGLGVFLDDVAVTEDGTVTDTTSFEADLGGFTAGPAPAGSEASTQGEWTRQPSLGWTDGPGIATADTLTYGFGFEGITGVAAQNAAMASAMVHLGVLPTVPTVPGGGGGGGGGGGPSGEDTDPPETTIGKEPEKKSSSTKAKFKFSSDEPGSAFECKLDKKDWKGCDSPRKYNNLDEGKHRFKVRATDTAGNTDPSPAKYRWRVESE